MQNDVSVNLSQCSSTRSNDNDKNKIKYLWQLPFDVRRALTDLLDADKTWRELGGNFINLSEIELELISYAILRKESPTNTMLIKWEQSNVTIKHLYKCLAKMKHFRAMSLIKSFVDENLQSFCTEQEIDVNSINLNFNSQNDKSILNLNCNLDKNSKNLNNNCLIKHNLNNNAIDSQPNDVKKKTQTTDMQSNFRNNFYTIASTINAHDDDLAYEELLNATENFHSSNIIGSGGFGIVYKGFWKGTQVAIKRLKDHGNFHQALTELRVLNQYRIDNIVPLYGISLDGPEPCLIYQFMVNGSLDDRIQCKKNTLPLSWLQRINIGFGIAKALNYLHTRKDNPLIHGDVKSANILLDAQLQPKLGDFGLAKYFHKSQTKTTDENNLTSSKLNKNFTHMTVTSVHGTVAYLPPEYLRCKILSPSVDVYSYGIVLLEMLSGFRAYNGKCLLIDLITTEIEDNLAKLSQTCRILGKFSNQIKISNKKQSDLNQNLFLTNNSCSCLNCFLYKFQDKKLSQSLQNLFWFHCILKLSLECCNKLKKKRPDFTSVLTMFSSFFDQFNLFNQAYQMNQLNETNANQTDNQQLLNLNKLDSFLEKNASASAPPLQTENNAYSLNNQNLIKNSLSNQNENSFKSDPIQLPLLQNLNISNQTKNSLTTDSKSNFMNEVINNYEIPLLTELGITKKN